MMIAFALLVTLACALPSDIARRADTIKKSIGRLGPGTYSLTFRVRQGELYDMAVADTTGSVYADTAPGWGWGPSSVPNVIEFEVKEAGKDIVFSATEESGVARLEYELKKTDTPNIGLLKTGQIN